MSLRNRVGNLADLDLLDESDVEVTQGETIFRIPKSEIYSIEQVRKQFHESSIEEMSASLEAEGQIQPIVVSERDPRGYCIQKGERRWRGAMHNANITHLDCIIRAKGTIWGQLAENIIREDLTPFEVGMAIVAGKEQYQLDNKGAARRLGISTSKVSAFIKATQAPDIVKKAYNEGVIGDVDSINSLRIAHELDPKSIEQLLARAQGISRQQAQALTRELKSGGKRAAEASNNESISSKKSRQPKPVNKSIRVKTAKGYGVIDITGEAKEGELVILLDDSPQSISLLASDIQLVGYHTD